MTRLSRGSLARARRGFAAAASIAALLMVWAFPGNAQTYPDRPIRVIVPIAAGSVTDVIMRATANELTPRLGQSFVIENKGGASGIPGCPGLRPGHARRLHALPRLPQHALHQPADVQQAAL
jgi:tripartite-type tricarboxylate transporter receptor subunit TctC